MGRDTAEATCRDSSDAGEEADGAKADLGIVAALGAAFEEDLLSTRLRSTRLRQMGQRPLDGAQEEGGSAQEVALADSLRSAEVRRECARAMLRPARRLALMHEIAHEISELAGAVEGGKPLGAEGSCLRQVGEVEAAVDQVESVVQRSVSLRTCQATVAQLVKQVTLASPSA